MSKKRDITVKVVGIAAAAALLSPIALASDAGGAAFDDVPQGAWYYEDVYYAAQEGLMESTGEGQFSPLEDMTRGMAVQSLYKLAGEPQVESGTAFNDVPQGSDLEAAARWANDSGVMVGYGDNTFAPQEPLTREQLATVLWRYAGSPQAAEPSFTDSGDISDWAKQAAAWAEEIGIMEGRPGGEFAPGDHMTRTEAAAVLGRYYREYIDKPLVTGELRPNEYDPQAFIMKDGFLTYEGEAPSYVGIDVSSHQNAIDWDKVAGAGVDFVMIRAGYRGYTAGNIFKDLYFTRNIEGALEAGLQVGIYFFSQARIAAEAKQEALFVLDAIDGYEIDYPVVFDWEVISGDEARTDDMPVEKLTECAVTFCEEIKNAGYTPMIYSNKSLALLKYDLSSLKDYDFWLAEYSDSPSFYYHYDIWQYSQSGTVDGIEASVDLNIAFKEY